VISQVHRSIRNALFKFPGACLYSQGTAVVHVVGIDPNDKAGLLDYLGDKGGEDVAGTGVLDLICRR